MICIRANRDIFCAYTSQDLVRKHSSDVVNDSFNYLIIIIFFLFFFCKHEYDISKMMMVPNYRLVCHRRSYKDAIKK